MKYIAPIIGVVGGIIFIFMGFRILKEIKSFPQIEVVVDEVSHDSHIDTDGTVVNETNVFVTYTIDGESYREVLQSASGKLKKGDTVKVYYDPDDPTYVSAATKGSAYICMGVGALFAILTVFSVVRLVIKGR
ncbi:MAG: hypothetical protein IJS90_00450 [Clostridia bacterium]|nr:hypothetical protein [Clostridia bacterium]